MNAFQTSGAACSGQGTRNRATAQPRNRATAQPRNSAGKSLGLNRRDMCHAEFYFGAAAITRYFFVFVLSLIVSNGKSEDVDSLLPDITPFSAEGTVTTEQFRPFNTNYVLKSEGEFKFWWSNGLWRVQFINEIVTNYLTSITREASLHLVLDCENIPDGVRQVIIHRESKTAPYATTEPTPFPAWLEKGLFLPWLGLCPRPDLPLINSNHIRFCFLPQFITNPANEGLFSGNYIEPQKEFLAELNISNNGSAFGGDGSLTKYPGAYGNGYKQISYEISEITNCDGIKFPKASILREYLPTPGGHSPEETYPVLTAQLNVRSINVGDQKPSFVFVPTNLVVLDSRPSGLHNGLTVNYSVSNDHWSPLTNKRMVALANMVRQQSANNLNIAKENSGRRLIMLCIMAAFTVTLLTWLFFGRRSKH